MISLKLVIEDPDVVAKVNENLPSQIRVWGIERTNASFSAYQLCDSRIYEYLIPTYCFLPPHPESFLGKKIVELAEKEGDLEGLQSRQEEVAGFWAETYEKYLDGVIDAIDPSIRDEVLKRFLYLTPSNSIDAAPERSASDWHSNTQEDHTSDTRTPMQEGNRDHDVPETSLGLEATDTQSLRERNAVADSTESDRISATMTDAEVGADLERSHNSLAASSAGDHSKGPYDEIELQLRKLKSALVDARRAWRIPQKRLDRVKSIFSRYVGSHKYHNYTIDKTFSEASATRVIKSFNVSEKPVIIGNTEWLSLKVHGQSFMMHQIRKMVSAAAMIARCGCHEGRIQDTFLEDRVNIPKAPSLGLLLERPSFDKYNDKLVEFGRQPIDFDRYKKEISEFKQREIYERIFRDEEKDSIFLAFFSALDSSRNASLLWLTSAGLQGMMTDVSPHSLDEANSGTHVAQMEEEDDANEVAEDS